MYMYARANKEVITQKVESGLRLNLVRHRMYLRDVRYGRHFIFWKSAALPLPQPLIIGSPLMSFLLPSLPGSVGLAVAVIDDWLMCWKAPSAVVVFRGLLIFIGGRVQGHGSLWLIWGALVPSSV
jgi:hypothetical protein